MCACEEEEHGEKGRGEGEEEEGVGVSTSISECEVDPDSGFISCLETKLKFCFMAIIFLSPPLKDAQDVNAAWWKRNENSNLNEH